MINREIRLQHWNVKIMLYRDAMVQGSIDVLMAIRDSHSSVQLDFYPSLSLC